LPPLFPLSLAYFPPCLIFSFSPLYPLCASFYVATFPLRGLRSKSSFFLFCEFMCVYVRPRFASTGPFFDRFRIPSVFFFFFFFRDYLSWSYGPSVYFFVVLLTSQIPVDPCSGTSSPLFPPSSGRFAPVNFPSLHRTVNFSDCSATQ